jgi:hypothetical protein
MWSAGVILLFFLTRKFPLFQSNDDNEALLEIACIIGKRKIEKAATLHSELHFFILNMASEHSTLCRQNIHLKSSHSRRRHVLERVRREAEPRYIYPTPCDTSFLAS